MLRYEVIESRAWQHRDGLKASIYGASPWASEAERAEWKLVSTGWTLRDNKQGTVGYGRPPLATRGEAQALADKWNAR